MGQYFLIVNKTKREFLHPHKLGSGLKYWEIISTNIPRLLVVMLRQSSEGGGGDIDCTNKELVGRWAGDEITIVGDYDDSKLYDEASNNYTDISEIVRDPYQKLVKDDSSPEWALSKEW